MKKHPIGSRRVLLTADGRKQDVVVIYYTTGGRVTVVRLTKNGYPIGRAKAVKPEYLITGKE